MTIPLSLFAEILTSLGHQQIPGAELEQRRSSRMRVEAPLKITLLSKPRDITAPRTITATTRDISPTGMGMTLGAGVTAGDRVIVQLPRDKNHFLLILSEVKMCSELSEGTYQIDLEFLKTLTVADLKQPLTSDAEIERIQRTILSN